MRKELKRLNFEKIKNDAEKFELFNNDSSIEAYQEFLKYFEKINIIDRHHLIISSHFTYGWMPTMINLNTSEIDRVVVLLNEAKNDKLLDFNELSVVKKCINNSLVGASKLLHFINPKIYAIWDSRVFRYLTEKKSDYGIGNINHYLQYLQDISMISKTKEYERIYSLVSQKFNYPITPNRIIEIIMFETDRKKEVKFKNRKK